MRIPNKLTANNPHAVAINQIIDCLRTLVPKSSDTIRCKHSTDGAVFEVISRPAQGAPKSAGMIFCGEYDPDRIYSLGDVVIISTGANIGTWVYVNASPSSGHAPYAGGGYWVQLPLGTLGQWM